jgi:hypothetical protein
MSEKISSIPDQSKKTQNADLSGKGNSSFFKPVVQAKLTVNNPNDVYEQEADRIAEQVVSTPSVKGADSFFKPASSVIQKAPANVQRDENDKAPAEDTGSKVLTEGASITYSQLKLQPGFEEWKEQQVAQLKFKLWENQPTDYKFGMVAFGLTNIGLLGATLASDPGFRSKTATALDDTSLPLFLLPGSEYLALSTFKYKLPSAENAPYTFKTEFDFDFFTKMAREKWGGPKIGLTVGVNSEYSDKGGFQPLTGGKIGLTLGGGIVNLQGFYNEHLPPSPMLISDPSKGEPPTWLMRSLPGQLEENLPLGTGVYLTVDVLRLPELFGGGQKTKPPPKREGADELSRKENNSSDTVSGQPVPSIVSDVLSTGGGSPLQDSSRTVMEESFNQDFSNVRIHTDSKASESAKAINAKAYTSGKDIVFDNGQYDPSVESGKKLLAHELVHVVQQSGSVQRKEGPDSAITPAVVPVKNVDDPKKDTEATQKIREKLELGNYSGAFLDLNDHLEWEGVLTKKRWLRKHDDIRLMFLKRLPAAVIADVYSAAELLLRPTTKAWDIIDCWYPSEQEKQLLYTQNLPLFDRMLVYISPYTGFAMKDVVDDLTKELNKKEYTSSFGNKEFHVINLLAPGIQRKFDFYKKYADLFKLVTKKFDPYTGIRHETMKNLTDTNSVDRERALFIYNQLRILDEEQRKAFIETGVFASALESDKDAEDYYKKKYGAQYAVLPHNWDAAIWPWTWGTWDAPFAERLTIDHVALMSSALNYEDKSTRSFGFDRGIDTAVDKTKDKTISDATKLIQSLQDDANFTDPQRLFLLLAIGIRAQMQNEIIAKVLLPKNTEKKITGAVLRVVENSGFVASENFKYNFDTAIKVDHDKALWWYATKQTLFGGKEGSVFGERRGTFDLRTLQNTESLKGSVGGLKFGFETHEGDDYYNNEWLNKQIKENTGSESLLPNINEYKGSQRQGKIYASISPSIKQANIYASVLPIEGLNYFGAGTLYRSGQGVLQGVSLRLSWTKDPSDPENTIKLIVGIENFLINNFQMVSPKGTLAIGEIGLKGLRLELDNDMLAKGYTFLGLFKDADLTVKTLMNFLPNVLKLMPYAVLVMTEEFKGVKAHQYKDAFGALMQTTFGSLRSSLTFSSVHVKNMYDTSAGFLDDFSIEEIDKKGQPVRQKIDVRESFIWTANAAQNIKGRIKTIDKKIRAIKARVVGFDSEKDIDTSVKIEQLEERKKALTNTIVDKAAKYEDRSKEMDELREVSKNLRDAIEALDTAYDKEKKDQNPLINYDEMLLLQNEKADLEKDFAYLDKDYYDDKKIAEGDNGGIKRYEARKRKADFDAKYRTYDVSISLKNIQIRGGNYLKDLINDTLKSIGFESPRLEGIENINIENIQSDFVASGKGASALGKKDGVAVRKIQIPVIRAPFLHFKTDSMRIEANQPLLETVLLSVSVTFAANPLDKDPTSLYKYHISSVTVEKATFDGLKVFMGKDNELPLVDFPEGVPVTAWGFELYDYDPEKGNINLRIRDIKASGAYQEKNEKDKTDKEVKFGIDTTLDNDTDAGKKNAIDLKYNKDQQTVETQFNIASAWIDALNLQSPNVSITSLPGVKAVEVKNLRGDVKVWLEKYYEGIDVKRDLTIDINSLEIGEIDAQGISFIMREDASAETDPKKKKTAKTVQEVSLPKEDKVSITGIKVSSLRISLPDTGATLSTTGTDDASVQLGKSDLGGIKYTEKKVKGTVLKALNIHSAKFDSLTFEAMGRNGRQYTPKEFLKFFGRTRLEGLEASASYSDDSTKVSAGVMGQKKITKDGLKNVPISIDFHEATDKDPEHYSLRLPLSRINLPALDIVNGDHHIIIPKPTDKYSLSYLSDVDVKLRAYVKIPDEGKVSYDIYLDSLDIGKMIVYGLEYHNSKLGVDVVFDKVAPVSIPDIKAGGFRFSSTKGFDVFGKAGGWIDAAVGPGKDIEASFASIKARLEDGQFLAESDKGRSALDINIASMGYRQDKDGNMSITLQSITGGFPKMKISQTDPVTKARTVTDISSIDKALYAEKVVVKLNADKTKEVEAEGLSAGGLKIVSTETKGAEVNTTTVKLDAGALNANSAYVKLNTDGSKEITLKGIRGGRISADLVSGGAKGKSEKNITLPDPEHIKVEEVKILIDAGGIKTITLVKPTVKKFKLTIPSQEKAGDYLSVICDLEINGDVTMGDGNFATMVPFASMAPGAKADAFVVNVPPTVPVQIKNLRLENKDTTAAKPSVPSPEKGLTADQERLLQLEKEVEDAWAHVVETPSHLYGHAEGMPQDNPDYEEAVNKWEAARTGYAAQKSKMVSAAKAEAAASRTKKYLDAVEGKVSASLVVYGTKLPLNVETYKGEKYVEISDGLVNGLKPVLKSIIGSTVSASFWNSDEIKKAGKSLQRWYTYGVPYTRGLIDAIAEGNGIGAALVFLEKTTISKGVLPDDKTMYGLILNFDTSWLLDIGSTDDIGVALCEQKYKHPDKDDFYNLYGMIEYYGYVSPALVSRTGQRDAANVKNLPSATQGQLDDKGIKEAIALLVGYIKAGFTQEADNIVKNLKRNITRVEVSADITLTPQDVIREILKEKKAGKFELDKGKKSVDNVHIEGTYTNDAFPKASGTIGGGPAGTGNIQIPGATYTSEDNDTKVSYDSIEVTPLSVDYEKDTYKLGNDSIQLKGLKAAFRKK